MSVEPDDESRTRPPSDSLQRIQKLEESVVHKIAAGEIIVSPTNALKELLENSLDAGASSIDVVVKDGGFKLLQITDNGTGIAVDDLPLLCERFATSKIASFADLQDVKTLGFRGEALASISHIAHLSVKTKTSHDRTATRAVYRDGKLVESKSTAGVIGTQVHVEDLFYNVPLRSQALRSRSASDEYQRVLDTVSRYAIEYDGTFSCRRHGDTQPMVVAGNSRRAKIRTVFGSGVANNLRAVSIPSNPVIGLMSVKGYVTGLNYDSKKAPPYLIFINRRMVSSDALSRGIRKLYGQHLPRGGHAFVFLDIEVNPPHIDVNVHPTKREVQFLYEPEIVKEIVAGIESVLLSEDNSRDFSVQSYLSATKLPSADPTPVPIATGGGGGGASLSAKRPRYEYKLVRTDPRQATLAGLVGPAKAVVRPPPSSRRTSSGSEIETADTSFDAEEATDESISQEHGVSEGHENRDLREVRLLSIRNLRDAVKAAAEQRLTQLFADHTFVGVVDAAKGLAAIQHDVRLYLVDYFRVASELIYQQGLAEFANFGTIHLGTGVSLNDLLTLGDPNAPPDALMPLESMAPMLEDYFSIVVKNGMLIQLPLIAIGITPSIARLPQFAAELAAIDWSDEVKCLGGILRALAAIHIPTADASSRSIESLFDLAKSRLVATRDLLPAVVEIANLPGLYRVFERC